MSAPGDVLIIILQMFKHDEYYQPYKINSEIDISEELIDEEHDRFEPCAII